MLLIKQAFNNLNICTAGELTCFESKMGSIMSYPRLSSTNQAMMKPKINLQNINLTIASALDTE